MRRIYHLVPRSIWDQSTTGPYRAESLSTEGFIHCSNAHQVAWAANKFHADKADLLVLAIDAGRLGNLLKDEDPGMGETFPHIYGPIESAAIVDVRLMQRGADGKWTFTE